MSNLIRPHYVEFMVGAVLGTDWAVVSGDWSGWDLEHAGGARIEIKPSAALQTWTGRPSLAGRTTRGSWLAHEGRSADLFVFAWHPVTDPARADQRDPWRWRFHVVPEREPPAQETIGLATIERRWRPVGFDDLRGAVAAVLQDLPDLKARAAG